MIRKLLREPTDRASIQLFRYFFVGGAAFAVDYGLLWALSGWCGVHYLLAAAISFAAGSTVNYALSVRWVFNDHVLGSRLVEFAAFVLIGLLGLGLNEAVVWSATELLGLHYLVSKIVSTAVVFFWNYNKRAIIIGAGPAGLTAAVELLRRSDIEPVIIEQDSAVGGISRTVRYKGNCMDIGGHRYFSKSDRVMNWWRGLMPVEDGGVHSPDREDNLLLVRSRLSRIYFLRRFFDYPISLCWGTMRNLGLRRLVRIGVSYAWCRLFPIREERSLEDFYINRFGRELYRTFFRDYTRKLWGVACSEISPEWGSQRVKGLSIGAALVHKARQMGRRKRADLDPKRVETSLIDRFWYPKFGSGHIWEVAAERITQAGGTLMLGCRVTKIHAAQGRITGVTAIDTQGRELRIDGDSLISTMPVRELIAAMDAPVPAAVREVAAGLVYRDFMTVGMLLRRMDVAAPDGRRYPPDTWIYIQERDVTAGRIQLFNNWSPYMVRDSDTVWIGVEYFVNEGDGYWTMPDEQFIDLAAREMQHIGLIRRTDLLDAHVVRMPKAYPAYFGTYDRMDEIRTWTDAIANLFLIGRNGMHRYNNIDHSMLTAMAAVDNILAGNPDKSTIWQVNTEQDYHESK